MNRTEVLEALAQRIAAVELPHPTRVAIDGISASGKTHLADALVGPLTRRGRPVIRAGIDGFHNPPEKRYRNGKDCPQAYYADSFNYPELITQLLEPLGPDGSLSYVPAVYDFRTESALERPLQHAEPNAILIFEGVLLHREELDAFWDLKIHVDVAFDESLRRAELRESENHVSLEALRKKFHDKYFPGQRQHLKDNDPHHNSDIVICNNDFERPRILSDKRS